MRVITFLCLLFTIPLLAALGHDIWHAYVIGPPIDPNKPFPFSDAGWIWTHYAPQSYQVARDGIPEATWKQYIGPVLEHKSLTVAAVPAFFFYTLAILMKLLGLGPYAGSGLLFRRGLHISRKRGISNDLPSRKKMVYKRK